MINDRFLNLTELRQIVQFPRNCVFFLFEKTNKQNNFQTLILKVILEIVRVKTWQDAGIVYPIDVVIYDRFLNLTELRQFVQFPRNVFFFY